MIYAEMHIRRPWKSLLGQAPGYDFGGDFDIGNDVRMLDEMMIEATEDNDASAVIEWLNNNSPSSGYRQAASFAYLMYAADQNRIEYALILLDAGMKPDEPAGCVVEATDSIAVARRGYAEIASMLLQSGADLYRLDKHGFTALMYASAVGSAEVVKTAAPRDLIKDD